MCWKPWYGYAICNENLAIRRFLRSSCKDYNILRQCLCWRERDISPHALQLALSVGVSMKWREARKSVVQKSHHDMLEVQVR
jgi:hypothetical protein